MRIFVEQNHVFEESGLIVIYDKELINHMIKSLRMKENDILEVSDTNNLYECKIEKISNDSINLIILGKINNKGELNSYIALFQGMTKSTKFDLIIQKNVEMGISEIIPVEMKRSITKIYDDKIEKKINRYQKIALEASMQSYRQIVPNISEIIKFDDILLKLKTFDIVLLAYENEKNVKLKNIFNKIENQMKIAVIIGPEGGIDDSEIKYLKDNLKEKLYIISLGDRILRTETAGFYLLAQLNYILD